MKIIVKTIAGSHLFGLNTETSDKDYKGVFIPDLEDVILGRDSKTISQSTGSNVTKNTKEDTDVELYSINKFIKMCEDGDTSAIELLFCPEEMIIEKTKEWDEIITNRDKFLCNTVRSAIGYSRHQINKYGIRGSRVGELTQFTKHLKQLNRESPTLKVKLIWDNVSEYLKNNKIRTYFY